MGIEKRHHHPSNSHHLLVQFIQSSPDGRQASHHRGNRKKREASTLGKKYPFHSRHCFLQYQPWIKEGNEAYVHHYVVNTCVVNADEEETFEQYLEDYPQGASCYDSSVNLFLEKCHSILMAWAVGGVVTFIFLLTSVASLPTQLFKNEGS